MMQYIITSTIFGIVFAVYFAHEYAKRMDLKFLKISGSQGTIELL